MSRSDSRERPKQSDLEDFKRVWNALSGDDQRVLLEILETLNSLDSDPAIAPKSLRGASQQKVREELSATVVELLRQGQSRVQSEERRRPESPRTWRARRPKTG